MTQNLGDKCVCGHTRYHHDRGTIGVYGVVTEDACAECSCFEFCELVIA